MQTAAPSFIESTSLSSSIPITIQLHLFLPQTTITNAYSTPSTTPARARAQSTNFFRLQTYLKSAQLHYKAAAMNSPLSTNNKALHAKPDSDIGEPSAGGCLFEWNVRAHESLLASYCLRKRLCPSSCVVIITSDSTWAVSQATKRPLFPSCT